MTLPSKPDLHWTDPGIKEFNSDGTVSLRPTPPTVPEAVPQPVEGSRRGINAIRGALAAFYPTADEQDLWLQSPHPLLGGEAADDLVGTDQEYRVWALIDQLESGAFV